MRREEHTMMSEVRITPEQARQHQADLLAAVGATPNTAVRRARRRSRGALRRWERRPVLGRRPATA
jgi:hypothetical protein